ASRPRAVRELDGEDATLPGEVLDPNTAAVCVDRLLRDRESETEPASIRAELDERRKRLVDEPVGEPTAAVLDFDDGGPVVADRTNLHAARRTSELDRVAEEVRQRRVDEPRVDGDVTIRLE